MLLGRRARRVLRGLPERRGLPEYKGLLGLLVRKVLQARRVQLAYKGLPVYKEQLGRSAQLVFKVSLAQRVFKVSLAHRGHLGLPGRKDLLVFKVR